MHTFLPFSPGVFCCVNSSRVASLLLLLLLLLPARVSPSLDVTPATEEEEQFPFHFASDHMRRGEWPFDAVFHSLSSPSPPKKKRQKFRTRILTPPGLSLMASLTPVDSLGNHGQKFAEPYGKTSVARV